MLRVDLHTHSLRSGHALNTVYEMAKEAKKRKVRILGITDHGPSMEGAPHEGYFWISDKLTELYGVEILLGSEVNIINKNGDLDLNKGYLKKQSVVIAGLHDKTPYKGKVSDNTPALINAMKNRYVKIISHPFRPEYKVDVKKVVEAAFSTHTLLELNDQLFWRESGNKTFLETYIRMVSYCKKLGLPMIVGSDAHLANRIGENKHIMKVKRTIGLTDDMIINNREAELRLFLKSNKEFYHF